MAYKEKHQTDTDLSSAVDKCAY